MTLSYLYINYIKTSSVVDYSIPDTCTINTEGCLQASKWHNNWMYIKHDLYKVSLKRERYEGKGERKGKQQS